MAPTADPSAALGPAVRARRVQLDLQQADLADLAGCSRRFVTALESGKSTVQLDKVLDVLAVLGFDLQLVPGPGGGITVGDPSVVGGHRRRVSGRRR